MDRYLIRYEHGAFWCMDTWTMRAGGADYRRIRRFDDQAKAALYTRLRNRAQARLVAGRERAQQQKGA